MNCGVATSQGEHHRRVILTSVRMSVTELVVHIACWHPCAACPLCQQPQAKDGDAAFLDIGTRVYTVKGYLPTFRLAAYLDGVLQLYEADTNPCARTGADLLRHRWEGSLHWHH